VQRQLQCHIEQYEVGTLAVDGLAVTFGTARRLAAGPVLAVPNVMAHPSTASVPITVLSYKGPLLCGFNVPIKGLIPLPMGQEHNNDTNVLTVCLRPIITDVNQALL